MFNFQKEVILNSLDNVTVVKAPAKGSPSTAGTNLSPKLRFLDGGEYFKKYIVDATVYKTPFEEGEVFELKIKPTNLKQKHIQILVELGLDNDYRGDFGSALWYFRKPILVDLDLTSVSADSDVIEELYKAFSTVVPSEYKFVKVEKDGSTSVNISGADTYMKVRSVVINEFVCEDRCEGSSEGINNLLTFKGTSTVSGTATNYIDYTRNKAEFGTYNYLLHNFRLPTYENLRFTSPSAPEMPIKGATYVQYSFAYCVPRVGFGGLSVAGQTNYSTTLHTFYVKSDLTTKFESYLKNKDTDDSAGIEVKIQDIKVGANDITILPDLYASSQDLAAAAGIKENADAIKSNSNADKELTARVTAVETKNTSQDTEIGKKANSADVYTKAQANEKFQAKS